MKFLIPFTILLLKVVHADVVGMNAAIDETDILAAENALAEEDTQILVSGASKESVNAMDAEKRNLVRVKREPCPNKPDVVCVETGATVFNECYARAQNLTISYKGPCFANCPNVKYIPVCGSNGITYPHKCEAEARGITSYTSGRCSNKRWLL